MDDDSGIRPASIQHDDPARSHAETREETVARLVDPAEAASAGRGGSPDPSTRRGLTRRLWIDIGRLGAAGFVFGAVLALVLSFLPGPIETHSDAGVVLYMLVLGAAFALGVAVIGNIMLLAREDGRVEREVEGTGRRPEGLAGPVSPRHEPEPR